jgi:hypothetical protein
MKLKNLTTIFVLISSLYLISCSTTQSAVIGKWQKIDSTETIEFRKDGTVQMIADKGIQTIDGTYTFVEDNRVHMDFGRIEGRYGNSVDATKIDATVSVSGNELTLTYPKNKGILKYQKVS